MLSFVEFEKMYESYGFVTEGVESLPKEKDSILNTVTKQDVNVDDLEKLLKQLATEKEGKSGKNESLHLKEEINPALANKDWTSMDKIKKLTGLAENEIIKSLGNLATKEQAGLTKNDVKVMQAFIDIQQKFTKPDGGYGKGTIDAVKNWQKYLGISKPDGIWGPKTGALTFVGDGKSKGPLFQLAKSLAIKTVTGSGAAAGAGGGGTLSDPNLYKLGTTYTFKIGGIVVVLMIPNINAGKVWAGISEAAKKGIEFLKAVADAAGNALLFAATGAFVISKAIADTIIACVSGLVNLGKGLFSVVGDFFTALKTLGSWAKSSAGKIYQSVKKEAKEGWAYIVSAFKTFIDQQKANAAILGKFMATVLGACWEYLKNVGTAFLNLVLVIFDPLKKLLNLTWTTFESAVKSSWGWIKSNAKDWAQQLKAGYNTVKSSVVAGANAVYQEAKDLGNSAIKAAGEGLSLVGQGLSAAGAWMDKVGKEWLKESQETGDFLLEELALDMIYS